MVNIEKYSIQELFSCDYTYETQNKPLDNALEQLRFRNEYWQMLSETDEKYCEDYM